MRIWRAADCAMSEAVTDQVAAELLRALPERAIAPRVELDLLSVLQIGAEDILELRREARAENDGVRFVIVQEAQVVEVAAADGRPVAVDDHGFGVKYLLL